MRVDPIKDPAVVDKIQKRLYRQGRIRDWALVTVGFNTNLRASDLVRLKVRDVDRLKPGEWFVITEVKTGKMKNVKWNKACHAAAKELIEGGKPQAQAPRQGTTRQRRRAKMRRDDYLFKSRQGGNKALSTDSVYRILKAVTEELRLPGRYGSHTMRKTWGYLQFHSNPTPLRMATLMAAFNHARERETMLYLGLEREDLDEAFDFVIGCVGKE